MPLPSSAGLCTTCVHAQAVESSRGSVFVLCRLSASDPRFPRYPRLPVVACAGYRRLSSGPPDESNG
jgi:hypothetical protein